MRLNRIAILLCCSLAPEIVPAQGNDSFEEFRRQKREALQNYRNRKRAEFEAFRAQKNKEFAEYLAQSWSSYQLRKGFDITKSPDPVKPTVHPVAPPDQLPPPAKLPIKQIKDYPSKAPDRPADIPRPDPEPGPDIPTRAFTFFGTQFQIHAGPGKGSILKGHSERDVSEAWKLLSGPDYDPLLADCQDIAQKLSLNDWGLFKLTEKLAHAMTQASNDAYLMQAYLMAQFGYDVRLCRIGRSQLGLLVPIKQTVCGVSYYNFNGIPFYIFGPYGQETQVESYGKPHGNATRLLDLNMRETPTLTYQPSESRAFSTPDHAGMTCQIDVNRNLMDYYAEVPQVNDWGYYASQPMDSRLVRQLYPTLQRAIEGKTQAEAAGMLLNFVQKAFAYLTDQQQFGQEKYNFGEENFYYKACDCEDRSILYFHLVRDLLQLDAVLLHYPNHLATAVRFPATVKGDHVMVGGQAYTVCDPTYIGADIGMCMPQFKASPVEIIKIKE